MAFAPVKIDLSRPRWYRTTQAEFDAACLADADEMFWWALARDWWRGNLPLYDVVNKWRIEAMNRSN